MSEQDLERLRRLPGAAGWRLRLAGWIESPAVQKLIVGVIAANAAILGLQTSPRATGAAGYWLEALDRVCLLVFIAEIVVRLLAYGRLYWRSGWNVFDFAVVAVALVPGGGPWAVLRALRGLRILRLFTVMPSLRKVVAAFLHALPGLGGVALVLAVFLYTAAILATNLFGHAYPQWFGDLGRSLFSLFQILTLEGWADMAREVMETYPWAALFFVPFIVVATFAVLNLFIGIIVSSMQELALKPEEGDTHAEPEPAAKILRRLEPDLKALLAQLEASRGPTVVGGRRSS